MEIERTSMAPTWKPAEVKRMASTIRNYSVNNQVDVRDATWKSYLPNFDQLHATIVQEDAQWTWTASQMQAKWKKHAARLLQCKK